MRPADALDRVQDRIQEAEDAGELDQRRAPLLEALEAVKASDLTQFCIPAHKNGAGVDDETARVLGLQPFVADAPLHVGLDDRVSARKVLAHAQSLAAAAYGADQAFFSTNGTTLSVQLSVAAVARPGERLAVARNVHKSVTGGIVLGGADPVWIDPAVDREHSMAHCVTPEAVERALGEAPNVKGVLIVTPTYFGAAADVATIARICHDHGVPLLCDDAWGAHFPFHPELPDGPVAGGADLVVSSFHKSLTGIMQSSLIAVQGDRIDVERLELLFDLYESSSTSALLVAAMDGTRRLMVTEGERRLGRTLELARRARAELAGIEGLGILGPELVGRPGVAGFDETKLTIDVRGLGITGFAAADWLYAQCRVASELADHNHVMFLLTIADDGESVARMLDSVRRLAAEERRPEPLRPIADAADLLAGAEYPVRPRDAFLGPTRRVPLDQAVGEVAAEPVSPYPPGVPVLVPGQRITQVIVDFLQQGVDERMLIQGAADGSMSTLRVVAAP